MRERQKRESKNQRYITRVVKAVDSRAQGRCEYVSPSTGERCACRTKLVYDHIRPMEQKINSRGRSRCDEQILNRLRKKILTVFLNRL